MTSSARSCFQLLTVDPQRGRIGPGWNPKAQRPGLQSCRTVEGQGGRYNSLKLGLACANDGPVPQFVVSLGVEGRLAPKTWFKQGCCIVQLQDTTWPALVN